jgi:hypothetical protein
MLAHSTVDTVPTTELASRSGGESVAAPYPATLEELNNGELAVAIHTAGFPARWRGLSVTQIADLALTGIARLGLPEIHRISRESRTLALAMCEKRRHDATADISVELQELRRIWSSPRREQAAVDLAFRLTARRSSGAGRVIAA